MSCQRAGRQTGQVKVRVGDAIVDSREGIKNALPERGKGRARPKLVTEIGWSLVTSVTIWINVRIDTSKLTFRPVNSVNHFAL